MFKDKIVMRKNYIAPQVEAVQLGSTLMQDAINIVHHSGGSNGGSGGGFDESQII